MTYKPVNYINGVKTSSCNQTSFYMKKHVLIYLLSSILLNILWWVWAMNSKSLDHLLPLFMIICVLHVTLFYIECRLEHTWTIVFGAVSIIFVPVNIFVISNIITFPIVALAVFFFCCAQIHYSFSFYRKFKLLETTISD